MTNAKKMKKTFWISADEFFYMKSDEFFFWLDAEYEPPEGTEVCYEEDRRLASCPECMHAFVEDDGLPANPWGMPYCPRCGLKLKW